MIDDYEPVFVNVLGTRSIFLSLYDMWIVTLLELYVHHITRVTRNFDTKHDRDIEKINSTFYETTCSDKPLFDPWGPLSSETSEHE